MCTCGVDWDHCAVYCVSAYYCVLVFKYLQLQAARWIEDYLVDACYDCKASFTLARWYVGFDEAFVFVVLLV